jgi:hypothetical protein
LSPQSAARRSLPLLIAGAIALLGLIIFRLFLNWNGLTLTVKIGDVAGLLAPLAFASAVIERAVEILISPWRDAEASKLEKAVAAIKARPDDPATRAANAADLKLATDVIDDYRGQTQRYAFAVSITLSLLVSIAGVRALWPFVDAAKFGTAISPAQQAFFKCVDVAVSATLLAGGADGIHSVVNAITSFFNATASKSAP